MSIVQRLLAAPSSMLKTKGDNTVAVGDSETASWKVSEKPNECTSFKNHLSTVLFSLCLSYFFFKKTQIYLNQGSDDLLSGNLPNKITLSKYKTDQMCQ